MKTIMKTRLPFIMLYICIYMVADKSVYLEEKIQDFTGCSKTMAMSLLVIMCISAYLILTFIQTSMEDNPASSDKN